MDKIIVAYWSQTGNTQAMAEAIGKGICDAGKTAKVVEVSKISSEDIKEANVFAMGCPAMGAEVLEEDEMEPFVAEVEQYVSGKKVALFGSYDWGDGQWMRDWEERMIGAGAVIVGGEGLIAQDAPDSNAIEACINLGRSLASE